MKLQIIAKQLEDDEEYKATQYRCTKGKWTIGIGRNLTANGLTKEERNYLGYHETGYQNLMLSKSHALYLLEHDIKNSCHELNIIFPGFSFYPEDIQHVLINLIFQLGYSRFAGFRDMIRAIKKMDWKEAAVELRDSKLWREDTPERAERLAKRFEKAVKK